MTSPPVAGLVIGQLSQGGAERQCLELATGLKGGAAYTPVVFCTSGHIEPYGRLLTQAGVEWHAAPQWALPGVGKLLWLVRAAQRRRCRVLYGLLHVGNAYAGLAAQALGVACVASVRSATRPSWLLRRASAFACRRACAVVANSRSAARALEVHMGVFHPDVVVIPNAVRRVERSPADRDAVRRQLAVPPEAILVGTVANLKREKRVGFFLQMAAQMDAMSRAQPALWAGGLHFAWVGDGPDRKALDAALAGLPTDLRTRIHFPGASLEVERYLSAFDVFVLTSTYEGMPNALLEAMSAGLPCVATDVPGTRDVLAQDEPVGVLADAQDPRRFAEALGGLLLDRQTMVRIGRNASAHVRRRHGADGMVQAHTEVFDRAWARRAEGSRCS